jgi:hypothetical protein
MEAGSHSGIARLVQQSLGTSALFPSYVFVTIYKTSVLSLCGLGFGATRNVPRSIKYNWGTKLILLSVRALDEFVYRARHAIICESSQIGAFLGSLERIE